jgi:hypothetical protein
MVIVPADQVVLIDVWLVDNAVINDQNSIFILDLPDKGLDDLPEVLAGHGLSRQEAGDLMRVILSWLRPAPSRRDNPVAVVGPNEEIR